MTFGELAWLHRRFEDDYGRAYARLAAELRARYPEITRHGRRTGRALHNICFFVWCWCRHVDRKLIPTVFRAAVLLSAQDDYYDNPRIPAAQKEAFWSVINHALRIESFSRVRERSLQLRDLAALWSYVARTIPQSPAQVRSYWIETACQLNDAMAAENRAVRRATISYDEYMRTAVHSIGMVFIWATYLARKRVSIAALREMTPVLVQGATVVRLSNDMASYRKRRKKANAVSLLGGRHPDARIRRLASLQAETFRQRLEALDIATDVRGVMLHSVDFLRSFYERSDFDLRPTW